MADWHPAYTLLASVPVALLTSWVTVKLALRRFQSEKWFERKVDAYTNVIGALHHMKTTTDREQRAEHRGIELSDETREELAETYRSNLSEVRRLADMGALLFSIKAIVALDELERDLEAATPDEGWFLYYDAQSAATNKCLKCIREIAKRDLRA